MDLSDTLLLFSDRGHGRRVAPVRIGITTSKSTRGDADRRVRRATEERTNLRVEKVEASRREDWYAEVSTFLHQRKDTVALASLN
jgi:hypothetical protein